MAVFIAAWCIMVAAWFYTVKHWNSPSRDDRRKGIVGMAITVGAAALGAVSGLVVEFIGGGW